MCIDMESECGLDCVKWLILRNQTPSEIIAEGCVILKVGDAAFPCHRDILTSKSAFFELLFDGKFREAYNHTVSLPSKYVDEESFSKLLDTMYGEPLQIEDEDLPSLLITCSYLDLTCFVNECERYIWENWKKIDYSKLIVLPQLKEYSSLYLTVKKFLCQHFTKMYPRMIRIPFEVLEEILQYEELLIFGSVHALKFVKLWLSHFKRERSKYRKKLSRLLTPFRNHRKVDIVNRCKRYMESNFKVFDMAELFVSLKLKENPLLYASVKAYICQHFLEVHKCQLVGISFEVFQDLFSNTELFDLNTCVMDVITFSFNWVKFDPKNRLAYQHKILVLMKPFRPGNSCHDRFCSECEDSYYCSYRYFVYNFEFDGKRYCDAAFRDSSPRESSRDSSPHESSRDSSPHDSSSSDSSSSHPDLSDSDST